SWNIRPLSRALEAPAWACVPALPSRSATQQNCRVGCTQHRQQGVDMGRVKRLTPVRFKEILRRQNPPVFGQHYEPSIKATREEAPSDSRPAFVWSERLQRDISTLSKPERAVLCIVLYC